MRAAVVIGVDAVGGGLPRLRAAASGAREVAEWLRRSDYDVRLFTDEDVPVERSAVFRTVAGFVEAGTVDRLVVYFAGHGFLKGPVDEFWLLSGAPADPSEAVNLTSSAALARYLGIPQIVFISDACRAVPATTVHSGITGASIFPNVGRRRKSAQIDFYYGTLPGDPAHERSSTEAERAHGLFTRELLDAHKQAPDEALLAIGDRHYVRNEWLQLVMEDRVAARAERISLRLTQVPDIQLQIRDGYIARSEAPVTQDHYLLGPGNLIAKGLSFGLEDWADDAGPRRPAATRSVSRRRAERAAEKRARAGEAHGAIDALEGSPAIIGAAARASDQFQSRLGVLRRAERQAAESSSAGMGGPRLTCVGDVIERLAAPPDLTIEPGSGPSGPAVDFRMDGPASQVAVRFADGTGMLMPVLREYECEILRREGRTLSVTYSWLPYREPHLGDLRSEVLGAATLGLLDRSRRAATDLAKRLRQAKRFDPVLGLVAALAYTLAGNRAGATSVRKYMRGDLEVDLFDSWLLGGGEKGLPITPSLPLLAQTWSFLDIFDAPLSQELRQLARVPGFWTVFEAASMDRVMLLAHEAQLEKKRDG